jgi:Tol biopolymer transport system component/DNA-binding winged helix-turn-helix (wHTH) protein
MSNDLNNLYEFNGYIFNPGSHELRRNEDLILLSPKASELLKLLLDRKNEFISKKEIFEKLWAGTFVEDGVLSQNIYTLRKIIGNGENGKPLIENKTRLGYRILVKAPPVYSPDSNYETVAEKQNIKSEHVKERSFPKGSGKRTALAVAAGLSVLLLTGFFVYRSYRPTIAAFFRKPIETAKFQSLTNTGNISDPTISPDGNFAAFVRDDHQVVLQDLATTREIKLEIPNVPGFSALQFSPTGRHIYFRSHFSYRREANILKVASFGGETELIAEKTWGSFALSNEGNDIAFIRNQTLIIKNLENGSERELKKSIFPDLFLFSSSPAWSPDDTKIAFVIQNFHARRTSLFLVDSATGETTEIKTPKLQQFEQIAWHPDGDSLFASASEGGKFFHLWKIYYADGQIERLTNGLANYGKISVSADGKKLLALQISESSNLFVADYKNLNEQKQITTGNTNNVGQSGIDWLSDDKIIYTSLSEENPFLNIWSLNLTDNSRQPLTTNKNFHSDSPTISADNNSIFFSASQRQSGNIFRINTDGGGLTQITDGQDGFRVFPRTSNDGKYIYYIFRTQGGGGIKRFDLAANVESTLLEKDIANPVANLSISGDGKYLTFVNWRPAEKADDERTNFQFGIVSTEDPKDLRVFKVKLLYPMTQMSADGKSFDYISFEKGRNMILRQNTDGGEPKELYNLQNGRIFNFAWSRNNKQIVISQGKQNRDVVLLTAFE